MENVLVGMEEKVAEALRRMRKLNLYQPVINEFQTCGKLEYSEPTSLGGILYWVSNEDGWEKIVRDFEYEFNSLAYHVIHSYTEFGELLNILYVSDFKEEWELDNEDLEDNYVMVYCVNLTHPEFSEFGTICVEERAGGLIRVG